VTTAAHGLTLSAASIAMPHVLGEHRVGLCPKSTDNWPALGTACLEQGPIDYPVSPESGHLDPAPWCTGSPVHRVPHLRLPACPNRAGDALGANGDLVRAVCCDHGEIALVDHDLRLQVRLSEPVQEIMCGAR